MTIPRDFSSVDRRARMALSSRGLPYRPVSERMDDFNEAMIEMEEGWARYEATRCIHCLDPAPCFKACPAKNDISFTMWLIEQGEFLQAADVYRETNSMPEICGRICPQDRLCEGACVRGKRGELPVPCGALEAFVTDYQRHMEGANILVGEPTGRKVAIIGAGPAGLSCAEQLVRLGHWVTIYDTKPYPGGLLVYGIPNFKLEKKIFFDMWNDLVEAGVSFVGNTYIGRKITVDDLFEDGFEAVFIAVGTPVDAPMRVFGEFLPGVYKATDFLVRANVDFEMLPPGQRTRPEVGKRVVVIGGGDTASDCLRTALRMGATEVTCLYRRTEEEMPGGLKDRHLATEEGATFKYLIQPLRFLPDESGRLVGVECVHTELGSPDAKGRRRPVMIRDSNFLVPADTAILALGYEPDPIVGATTPGVRMHDWGLLQANLETGETNRFGVFTGGDVVTGPDLVVRAMVAGRKAAVKIDNYLGE